MDDAAIRYHFEYDLGQSICRLQYWYLSGNGVKPEPYDPQHPEHAKKRPTTKITMQLASLSEMKLTFEQRLEFFNFSNDYKKIVLPSINALNLTKDGGNPLKALNEKWVKIRKVEGFTPNRKNPERGNYQTWVFEKAFVDENACRSDYLANANREDSPWEEEQTDSKAQPAVHNDLKKQTLSHCPIFIDEACKTLGHPTRCHCRLSAWEIRTKSRYWKLLHG